MNFDNRTAQEGFQELEEKLLAFAVEVSNRLATFQSRETDKLCFAPRTFTYSSPRLVGEGIDAGKKAVLGVAEEPAVGKVGVCSPTGEVRGGEAVLPEAGKIHCWCSPSSFLCNRPGSPHSNSIKPNNSLRVHVHTQPEYFQLAHDRRNTNHPDLVV